MEGDVSSGETLDKEVAFGATRERGTDHGLRGRGRRPSRGCGTCQGRGRGWRPHRHGREKAKEGKLGLLLCIA